MEFDGVELPEFEERSSPTEESGNFDPGDWTLIPTDGTGLLCGLFALAHSIRCQTDWLRIPTVDELQYIATTGVVHERIQELQEFATEETWHQNFLEDHLDVVLQEYGLLQGVNLQLGVHHADQGWRLTFPVDDRPEVHPIWIHHESTGAVTEDGKVVGHYSGMSPPF